MDAHLDLEPMRLQRADNGCDYPGKILAISPIGKKVDVSAGAVPHAVRGHGIAAGESESLASASLERDFCDLLVAWFHGRQSTLRLAD